MMCKACHKIFQGHAPGVVTPFSAVLTNGRINIFHCLFNKFYIKNNNDTKDLGLRHYKSVLVIIQRFVAGTWLARLHALCK